MQRAYSVNNVLGAKFNGLDFEGKWLDFIGKPELAKSWIVWGQSGSGKTTFLMMLAKYLSNFERVLYNSLEEGLSMSIQNAYTRAEITSDNKVLLVNEPMAVLNERLLRPKSPRIVFIDSIRYTRFRWRDYEEFCKRHPAKILVWVGHAKGQEPKGALAEDIRYDSFVKIYVEGFRAHATSRYSVDGNTTFDVYEKGALEYWNKVE